LHELAERLKVNIPKYAVDKFVIGKMHKVDALVTQARAFEPQTTATIKAVDRLDAFIKDFKNLRPSEISSMDDWEKFLRVHASEGWKSMLHYNHILLNFVFYPHMASKLQHQKIQVKDDNGSSKMETLELHSFRWLSKAFNGYSPQGCLTDCLNLVFAMLGRTPDNLAELEIARVVNEFKCKLDAGDLSGLWLPTHLVMDCESDDSLCWLLLEHMNKKFPSSMDSGLQVLAQLPHDDVLDGVAADLEANANCTVFRDPDSRNLKAIIRNYGLDQEGVKQP